MTNQLLIGYNSCNSCFFGSLFCSRFVQIIFFIYKITLLGKCLVVSPLKIYELMLNFVLYMLYIIQLLVCDIVQANYQVFSYRKKKYPSYFKYICKFKILPAPGQFYNLLSTWREDKLELYNTSTDLPKQIFCIFHPFLIDLRVSKMGKLPITKCRPIQIKILTNIYYLKYIQHQQPAAN